jgi:tripartite ATP-independent transporter DctM subunit
MQRIPLVTRVHRILQSSEDHFAFVLLALITLLPTVEVILRLFRTGLHSSAEYVTHLVLAITFAGGILTSRQNRHLSLSVITTSVPRQWAKWLRFFAGGIATAVCAALSAASFSFARDGFSPDQRLGILPLQWIGMIMPAGFAIMAFRSSMAAADRWRGRLGSMLFAAIPFVLSTWFAPWIPGLVLPLAAILIGAAVCGTPIFAVLGGLALLFIQANGGAAAVIPNEAYSMLTGPVIPTIPLFTFAGFILSEGKSGERLVRFFQALLGVLPGGLAVMAVVVCAFFTTFTGASGVTILALGGLLAYMLSQAGYRTNVTTGLLTASGSIGLLFPPSLPVILYGVVAHVNIRHLFAGGLLPGLVMVGVISILGIQAGVIHKATRASWNLREILSTGRAALGELLLPVVIIVLFFSGATTLVETGAIAVCYSLILVMAVHRDVRVKDLSRVALACLPIIGGVLVILSAANGLSYYLVDAEIPMTFASWMQQHISSKYLFLLLLNCALLVTGCFMDIFSATMVIVPLIVPMAAAYGINPVHLGIIFLTNLELGYLTPPVGLNLFLASYRFNQPLAMVIKNVIPFLLALIAAVLLITYVPWITTCLID